jgi:hypothetical protein
MKIVVFSALNVTNVRRAEELWIAVNFHSILHNQNILEENLGSNMAVPIS